MLKDGDPDHWKLGVLYYNADHPRLFVARCQEVWRSFTLIFANPIAWTATAMLPALAIAGLVSN